MKTIFGVVIALLLLLNGAWAQPCGALPNNLTNGTVADATQVMGNFNALLTCINGIGINAGTAGQVGYYASTGSVISGESLSNLIDSSIGSTQGSILYRDSGGWQALAPGAAGQFLETQGIGENPQWASTSGGSELIPVNAQSGTTYTVASSDLGKLVTFSNTAAQTVTLPQAGSTGFLAGWYAYFRSNGTGLVTFNTTSSTIGGQSHWYLQNGSNVIVVSDGTNWQVYSQLGFLGSQSAFSLQVPDNAATGGNARGTTAVDLQLSRAAASDVASGTNAVAMGVSNTASGQSAIALGDSNTVSATYSLASGSSNSVTTNGFEVALGASNTVSGLAAQAMGEYNTASGSYSFVQGTRGNDRGNEGAQIMAQTEAGGAGAQLETYVLTASTSSSTAVRLTYGRGTASAATCAALGNYEGYIIRVDLIAYDTTSSHWWTFALGYNTPALIFRGANAASTTIGTGNPIFIAGGTDASAPTISTVPTLTADTTNGCPNISFTPPSGNTDTIHVAAALHVVMRN